MDKRKGRERLAIMALREFELTPGQKEKFERAIAMERLAHTKINYPVPCCPLPLKPNQKTCPICNPEPRREY